MVKAVKDVLAQALSRAREAGLFEGATNQAEAAFLGLSAAMLSRIKNNKTKLTDRRIREIAQKLSSGDASHAEQLRRELLESREEKTFSEEISRPASNLIRPVREFFGNISSEKHLLCVDYRDLPQTLDNGEYSELAKVAAEAIANGLHFAMFQPFGPYNELKDAATNAIEHENWDQVARDYIFKLAQFVRRAYKRIKELAGNGMQGEIVLYEATRMLEVPACGLNSRLFFVDSLTDEGHDTQVYQWVDGRGDNDYFIHRGDSALSKDAVSQQFFPIPDYWTLKTLLPKDAKELVSAMEKAEERFELSTKRPRKDKAKTKNSPWSVHSE